MLDPVKLRNVIDRVSAVATASNIDNPAVLDLFTVTISIAVRPVTVNVCVLSELALTAVGLSVAENVRVLGNTEYKFISHLCSLGWSASSNPFGGSMPFSFNLALPLR